MNIGVLKKEIEGDVYDDEETLTKYSRDASLFELRPKAVVFPRNVRDLSALVRFVRNEKKENPRISLTARSGGTDMTGGALTEWIVVGFEKYFNRIKSINGEVARVEPGVFYRDFEKETLKRGLILPSFPASREICAIGGMVSNNSGGEKTLRYGKTEKYVAELKAVLADGNEYVFRALNEAELGRKLELKNFEGDIYRKMRELISDNYDLLAEAKPKVSKNSAGYYLWNVWDKEKKTFDLTKLLVGSQGTLGMITEVALRLVPVKSQSRLVVVFMRDLSALPEIINSVLPMEPESFESYDDKTFKLAVRYFYSFASLMGTRNVFKLIWKFLPEILLVLRGGIPKLVLLIEFASDNGGELDEKTSVLENKLRSLGLTTKIAASPDEINKYRLIRRESFNLLRQRIKGKHTAPFIDDIIVDPKKLSEFLPRLNSLLGKYDIIYTLAGHVGDGNFHIIPLMNLRDEKERGIIHELADRVYDLVLEFGGSITAEHNDGLIRSPYLKKMYGEKVYELFEETKRVFDPENIFNAGKKVGSDLSFALNHIAE